MPGWKGLFSRAGLNTDGSNINAYRGNITARNFPGVLAGVPSGYSSNTWYVDSDKTTSGNGQSWVQAYKTVTEALAAAGDHDVILIQKGIYDEGAVLNITQEGLKMFGMGTSGDIWGNTTIKASAANHICITVNANEVEIGNLAFVQNNANLVIQVATTGYRYKTHIHDCYFGGLSTMTFGVRGGTTYDAVDTLVERCTFYQCVTGVELNGSRCTIRDNMFLMSAGDTGINVAQSGSNRSELRILGNTFRGADSSDTGIKFSSTPTEALFTMEGNRVYNVATPVTLSKYTSWYEGNFWGVEDWRYHQETGRNAALARGADGNVFYCDGNIAAGGDGKCWASASITLAAAIALSHADIAANRNWARRNTIYLLADQLTESLVLWPQKTDIVGVGSDAGHAKATIKGVHSPATNTYYSTRWYNVRFQPVGTGVTLITLTSGGSGTQFHQCTFIGIDSAKNCAKAIDSTAHAYLVINDCDFLGEFSGDVIDLGAGAIEGLRITGNRIIGGANDGIVVTGTLTHYKDTLIADNYIQVEEVTIDDGADGVAIINNRCISRNGTYGAGTHVITIGDAVGNIVVDKDGVAYTIPDLNVN